MGIRNNILEEILVATQAGLGLTEEQEVFLGKWTYDESSDTYFFDASLDTKPSSIYLGRPFKISNGVQAVAYVLADGTNAIGLVNRFGEQGSRSNPSFFALAPREDLEINTVFTETLTGDITVAFTTLGDNLTADFMFRPASPGKLTFEIWLGSDDTGAKIFDQDRVVTQAEVDSVQPISFGVGNKYLLDQGTDIFVKFSGINLFGSVTLPFFISKINPFTQVQINGHVQRTIADQDLFIGCTYETDTTAGEVTLTVPLLFNDGFTVSDADNSFHPSRPCNVDFSAYGQGVAVLQASRDNYRFYYDGTEWRFKDLNTGNGGVV